MMKIKERDKSKDTLAHENLLGSSDQNAFFDPPNVVLDENDFESMQISEGNFFATTTVHKVIFYSVWNLRTHTQYNTDLSKVQKNRSENFIYIKFSDLFF